jgi:Rps23 Pro-64 3,4-dihydroxylase Tpa1-like proline 4-hydroxylase
MAVFSERMQEAMHGSGNFREVKETYDRNSPYPYCLIRDICEDGVLRSVRQEIIENFEATYKETDLFKMLQTVDLANLDGLDQEKKSKIPNLLALRDAIYSPEFREFVSEVTGCGQLSTATDCACNIHPVGGHLLCHDDVIGDRRVSYIIYLTDPDDPWVEDDGGALELYPEDPESPQVPHTIPSARALPLWNSMAMFKVEAGKSFHSIQEVFTAEKPRMSLQGWFHGPKPEESGSQGRPLPTLAMLQAAAIESDSESFEGFKDIDGKSNLVSGDEKPFDLSDEDRRFLAGWINPLYLDGRGTDKLQKAFEEDGSIHLLNFLREDKADEIKKLMIDVDSDDKVGEGRRPEYSVGVREGWRLCGPAHMQRYLRYGLPRHEGAKHAELGRILYDVYDKLISSVPFANLIRTFTTLSMIGCRGEIRRFRPGLDYTVAHYGALTKDPRLDVVLTFVDNESMSSSAWEDGECGGFEAYLLADEEEDGPAEVYRQVQDDDSGVLNVSASFNSISIVLRDEGLMRFIKYVSSTAPGSRFDVSAIMLPQDDESDTDE